MKKLVSVVETGETAFESLMGENVILFCLNYIYTGKLTGVNGDSILIEAPHIVFETGKFSDSKFKDAQPIGTNEHFIIKSSIESFGITKQKV